MVNTNYHKSINKTLILKNYFDGLQKRLLLGDNHPGFAIGILMRFQKRCDKYMEHFVGYQQSYPQYSHLMCETISNKMLPPVMIAASKIVII
jgi:hypothetical protein